MCAFKSQRAIRQALLGASQAARGTPSVGDESVRPLPLALPAPSALRPEPSLTSVPLRTGRRRGAARQARLLDAQARARARRRTSPSPSLHSVHPPLHALMVPRSCSQAAVRRALDDLKAQGRPQDAAMKRVRRPSPSQLELPLPLLPRLTVLFMPLSMRSSPSSPPSTSCASRQSARTPMARRLAASRTAQRAEWSSARGSRRSTGVGTPGCKVADRRSAPRRLSLSPSSTFLPRRRSPPPPSLSPFVVLSFLLFVYCESRATSASSLVAQRAVRAASQNGLLKLTSALPPIWLTLVLRSTSPRASGSSCTAASIVLLACAPRARAVFDVGRACGSSCVRGVSAAFSSPKERCVCVLRLRRSLLSSRSGPGPIAGGRKRVQLSCSVVLLALARFARSSARARTFNERSLPSAKHSHRPNGCRCGLAHGPPQGASSRPRRGPARARCVARGHRAADGRLLRVATLLQGAVLADPRRARRRVPRSGSRCGAERRLGQSLSRSRGSRTYVSTLCSR